MSASDRFRPFWISSMDGLVEGFGCGLRIFRFFPLPIPRAGKYLGRFTFGGRMLELVNVFPLPIPTAAEYFGRTILFSGFWEICAGAVEREGSIVWTRVLLLSGSCCWEVWVSSSGVT